jgi:PAS domain
MESQAMDERLGHLARYFMGCRHKSEIDPLDVNVDCLKHIFILEIERDDAGAAGRLRIRLTGTSLDTAFGRQLRGHYLEEFIHGPSGHQVLKAFARCAANHEPAWMRQVIEIRGQAPRFIEGVAVYVAPDRICGGLIIGELSKGSHHGDSFETCGIDVAVS